jgi:hypothetical protein
MTPAFNAPLSLEHVMSPARSLLSCVPLLAIAACTAPDTATLPSEPMELSAARAPTITNPTAEFTIPGDVTLGLRNDGVSSYQHKVCGVNAVIFATGTESSGDAIMDTDNPRFKDTKCASYPRKLTVNYGDATELSAGMINVHEIANASYSIPLGSTVNRAMNFSDVRCGGLRWRTHLRDGTFVGGDSVRVERTGSRTWRVYTEGVNNRAWCTNTGALHNISVDFTITADRDMP